MGSILPQGQGRTGGASADGFDWDKALADAQPITPPASGAPPFFKNRRSGFLSLFGLPPYMFTNLNALTFVRTKVCATVSIDLTDCKGQHVAAIKFLVEEIEITESARTGQGRDHIFTCHF
jgi:hypothetical protein